MLELLISHQKKGYPHKANLVGTLRAHSRFLVGRVFASLLLQKRGFSYPPIRNLILSSDQLTVGHKQNQALARFNAD